MVRALHCVLGTALVVLFFAPAVAPALAAPGDTTRRWETAASHGASSPLLFGIDAAGVPDAARAGAIPDLATIWIGAWNLEHGWLDPGRRLDMLRAAGITPAIHLYFWGDDLSPACLADGCDSDLHGAHKDVARWHEVADGLVGLLSSRMRGGHVVVLLETEFNKGSVRTHEPLDAGLADMATRLRAAYENVTVVLPLGNWDRAAWSTWDRAAAASDAVGIQASRASTRHDAAAYEDVVVETLVGAAYAGRLFGKPVWVHDVALSSYDGNEALQARVLLWMVQAVPALAAVGVEAILYRSWQDVDMDPANHFGAAERHWGLVRGDGTPKPAAAAWLSAVVPPPGRPEAAAPGTPDPVAHRSASLGPDAVSQP